MNKHLTTQADFVLWLLEHPSLTSKTWEANHNKWLISEACAFNENVGRHDGKLSRWDNGYHKNCDIAIGRSLESGGVSGGSCWDSSDPQEYTNDVELPNMMPILIEIVNYFIDNITLKDYLRFFNGLVRTGKRSVHEYYGNRDDYVGTYILVPQLYKAFLAYFAEYQ